MPTSRGEVFAFLALLFGAYFNDLPIFQGVQGIVAVNMMNYTYLKEWTFVI